MVLAERNLHRTYIDEYLMKELLKEMPNEELEGYQMEYSESFDGFMSALYNIEIDTKTPDGMKQRKYIAKFMKGEVSFRENSKSYIQFENEIYVYTVVLPEYENVLRTANITDVSVHDWVPKTIKAKYGYIKGLSSAESDRESSLVLEDLRPLGYVMGPRLYLKHDQLLGMCRPLGQYHAISYALRLMNPSLLERLKAGIVPLHFIQEDDPQDAQMNLYRVLYRVAFDRFFDYFDRIVDGPTFDPSSEEDEKLLERLRHLRTKYFKEPTLLLERIRMGVELSEEDRPFGVILHGDYNRNNVMFHYKEEAKGASDAEDKRELDDVKMIDFQELRYGTPAMDLSFFMYMNTTAKERADSWMEILKEYHDQMYGMLERILKSKSDQSEEEMEKELKLYSFDAFNAHFSRYAFYGVMVCMHFLPWILANSEECEDLTYYFETNMHGTDFHKISMEAGGDSVNREILEVIRHACRMGYMDDI